MYVLITPIKPCEWFLLSAITASRPKEGSPTAERVHLCIFSNRELLLVHRSPSRQLIIIRFEDGLGAAVVHFSTGRRFSFLWPYARSRRTTPSPCLLVAVNRNSRGHVHGVRPITNHGELVQAIVAFGDYGYKTRIPSKYSIRTDWQCTGKLSKSGRFWKCDAGVEQM